MDLNQLLHAHQIAMLGEARAQTRAHRAAHSDTIAALATRIRDLRSESGADIDAAPFLEGEPIAAYRDR